MAAWSDADGQRLHDSLALADRSVLRDPPALAQAFLGIRGVLERQTPETGQARMMVAGNAMLLALLEALDAAPPPLDAAAATTRRTMELFLARLPLAPDQPWRLGDMARECGRRVADSACVDRGGGTSTIAARHQVIGHLDRGVGCCRHWRGAGRPPAPTRDTAWVRHRADRRPHLRCAAARRSAVDEARGDLVWKFESVEASLQKVPFYPSSRTCDCRNAPVTRLKALRRMTTFTAGEDHDLDMAGLHGGCCAGESAVVDPPPPQASRREFLDGMRQVAGTVGVVTTVGPGGRHGATVTAFASVSADPPTVLVCLRGASRIAEAVLRNGVFTVSVLAEEHLHLARIFAGEFDHARAERFADVPLVTFPGLAPGIANASIFACTMTETMQQHTHAVVIGRVAHVATMRRPPLLYHDGSYALLRRSPNQ